MLNKILFKKNIEKDIEPNSTYLKEGFYWIKHGQENNKDGGIPAYYNIKTGYSYSYPETSGYILVSLLEMLNSGLDNFSIINSEINQVIDEIFKYLLEQQNTDGGWGHPGEKNQSMVFDTCQILEGFSSLLSNSKFAFREQILLSIYQSKKFLLSNFQENGFINEALFPGKCYAYQARSAAILIELGISMNDSELIRIGSAASNYAFNARSKNGFYLSTGNLLGESKPITHFVAYTLEGILRSGIALNRLDMIESVVEVMKILNKSFAKKNIMGIAINTKWKSIGSNELLSGLSQFSIINWILYDLTRESSYKDYAILMNKKVKKSIDLTSQAMGIRGGVKSCEPFSRKYYPDCYLNWALKFFLDAIMCEMKYKL